MLSLKLSKNNAELEMKTPLWIVILLYIIDRQEKIGCPDWLELKTLGVWRSGEG